MARGTVEQKWYDEGLKPRVLINWQSFVDWGITDSWKGPFTDAVINAYTRWMNLAGSNLRFQFWGYTTKTESDTGELVISMNERHVTSTRIASTFGSYNKLIIVFHRKNGSNLTPWNFVPYNAAPGEFDMQAILTHEFGHCFGLDDTSSANDTMNGSYDYHSYRFGPFNRAIDHVRNLYSDFSNNRLRQLRSTNGGSSWSDANNDITPYNHVQARTNLNLGVVTTPRSGLYVVGWSHVGSRIPTWRRGDGDKFLQRSWLYYGGERSIYGPTYAHDDGHTLLWSWVHNDDVGTIKVVRSTKQGFQWHAVASPTNARTYGTPTLCWTRVSGQSTWVLIWPHFDRTDHNGSGYLRASISTNDGSSWSSPVVLNNFYKVLSGVSAAADVENHIVVAFSWAPNSTYGINLLRSFICQIDSGQLRQISVNYTTETTRIQPAITYDPNVNRFVMAWRGQDYNTTLNTMSKAWVDTNWSSKVTLHNKSSHVAPSLASSVEYGESVMWYAYEG